MEITDVFLETLIVLKVGETYFAGERPVGADVHVFAITHAHLLVINQLVTMGSVVLSAGITLMK